jgi:DNA polymerase-3 subunit gamma/tau
MTDKELHIELYKKYRPNKWAHLIGQEKVARSLQSVLVADQVPTAYLFSGPRGTGKTSAALIFAKAINCENPDKGNPCNTCETCVSIDQVSQPGVTYISAAQNSGVDKMRELVSKARLRMPINRQVFIIDEIHNLKDGKGFEALLIPLEEKTMPALFIFCTTEINKVPRTILSRVQQRKFTLVEPDILTKYVSKIVKAENLDLTQEEIETAVRMGRGSVRDTLTALETVALTGIVSVSFGSQLLDSIATLSIPNTLKVVAEANKESVDMRAFAEQLFEDLRDLLLLAGGADRELVGIPPVINEEEIIQRMQGARGILYLMKSLGESITKISLGADPRILLEVSLLEGVHNLQKLRKAQS